MNSIETKSFVVRFLHGIGFLFFVFLGGVIGESVEKGSLASAWLTLAYALTVFGIVGFFVKMFDVPNRKQHLVRLMRSGLVFFLHMPIAILMMFLIELGYVPESGSLVIILLFVSAVVSSVYFHRR